MIFFSLLVISTQKEGSCYKGSSELWAAAAAAAGAGREIVVRVKVVFWEKEAGKGFLIWAGGYQNHCGSVSDRNRIRISISF